MIGEESTPPSKDISGNGGEENIPIPKPDIPTYIMPLPTLPSLLPTKQEKLELTTDQKKNDWSIDDFVYVSFLSQVGMVQDFGVIVNKTHNQYVVKLIDGNLAQVYIEAIKSAGRA